MTRACWLVEFKNKTINDEVLNALMKVPFFDGISYSKEKLCYEFKVYLNKYLAQDSFIARTTKNLSQNNKALFKNKKIKITDISNINWLSENYKLFKPVEFDNFVFFGDHIDSNLKFKKNMIRLNSSDAFGSGSHPTTKGCLYALGMLRPRLEGCRTARSCSDESRILYSSPDVFYRSSRRDFATHAGSGTLHLEISLHFVFKDLRARNAKNLCACCHQKTFWKPKLVPCQKHDYGKWWAMSLGWQ